MKQAIVSFLVVPLLFLSWEVRGTEGGCTSSCGGSDARIALMDLTVDTFTSLLKMSQDGKITMNDGHVVNVQKLYDKLTSALNKYEPKLVHSSNDQDCPLLDDSQSCVEFLSNPKTGELKVDIDRLYRHQADRSLLRRQMIHEGFRMARENDKLYQYSRQLADMAASPSAAIPSDGKPCPRPDSAIESLGKQMQGNQRAVAQLSDTSPKFLTSGSKIVFNSPITLTYEGNSRGENKLVNPDDGQNDMSVADHRFVYFINGQVLNATQYREKIVADRDGNVDLPQGETFCALNTGSMDRETIARLADHTAYFVKIKLTSDGDEQAVLSKTEGKPGNLTLQCRRVETYSPPEKAPPGPYQWRRTKRLSLDVLRKALGGAVTIIPGSDKVVDVLE